MRCRRAKALLPDHFERALSELNRRALEEHLAACPTCHARWRRLYHVEQRLLRVSQAAPASSRPRADFTASVMLTIAARQREQSALPGAAVPPSRALASGAEQVQLEELHASPVSPFGPWSAWDASALGAWMRSSRVVLSGALAALLAVMAAVVVVGVFLTQPALSTQTLNSLASLFSHIADGFYGLVAMLSALAENQLLLAGVAASYVSLALLWFYLMRQPHVEEVES